MDAQSFLAALTPAVTDADARERFLADPNPAPAPAGTWSSTGSYTVGDRVTSGGVVYQAVQSHTGVGDPNWIYAPSLWKKI